ncbi:hypothetical protein ASG12_06715 [Williamsia sp. Leaf354]|uniref:hypothetical protein n=1 Tax=Williamsia sp. Leaf354 TaxID=1736349 RepID=UPI0006F97B0B|nr:hypothetical protein [Williamsia sp. Leaf354]KQS00567.1 hypothetical protein ASG12_06715 [Williamsia sp. Leaf354]
MTHFAQNCDAYVEKHRLFGVLGAPEWTGTGVRAHSGDNPFENEFSMTLLTPDRSIAFVAAERRSVDDHRGAVYECCLTTDRDLTGAVASTIARRLFA